MENFFEFKNTSICYNTTGKGPAVVLIHGFLENQSMWDFVIPILSKKNKVITLDLFGHGKSENLGYVQTMEEHAEMIRALLKFLNIRKATFIGHSMGGYIALAFAELYPKNTKGFCLLNSTAYADSKAKKVSRNRAIKAVKANYKSFIKISIPMLFSEENRIILKDKIKSVTEDALNSSKQGIIASLEGMKIRKDRSNLLKNDKVKKMLILGENDTVLDISIHNRQVENTDTKLVILKQGHMSHIEQTADVVTALSNFA